MVKGARFSQTDPQLSDCSFDRHDFEGMPG
jgi:hypothetical protein